MSAKIVVLGAGSFGTALAKLKAEGGHQVLMWARDPEVVRSINEDNRHPRRLQQIQLPPGLRATTSLREAVSQGEFIVSAIPTVAVRSVWNEAKNEVSKARILSATKGIECETFMLVSDILKDVLPERLHGNLAYLSGPLAKELARRLPRLSPSRRKTPVVPRNPKDDFYGLFRPTPRRYWCGRWCTEEHYCDRFGRGGLGLGLTPSGTITRGLAEISVLPLNSGPNCDWPAGWDGDLF